MFSKLKNIHLILLALAMTNFCSLECHRARYGHRPRHNNYFVPAASTGFFAGLFAVGNQRKIFRLENEVQSLKQELKRLNRVSERKTIRQQIRDLQDQLNDLKQQDELNSDYDRF